MSEMQEIEEEGIPKLMLHWEETDLLKQKLTQAVKSALSSRDLSCEQIMKLGAFLWSVEILPKHYRKFAGTIKFTSENDDGKSWMTVTISEEGLALDQGGLERYDYGCDSFSKTVFNVTTTSRPDYEIYFDLEEWLRNFTDHAEDSHVEFSIDSVLGEKASS